MSLLSIKTRQKYLKELGFYKGSIDGINGKMTKDAVLGLQKKYFTRVKDIDGVYGNNTDILLRNAYNFKSIKHFKLEEFKCHCKGVYCTGYHTIINVNLINYLDNLREYYNAPISVESGLRCTSYNTKIGGINGSRHTSGKASDVQILGITNTLEGRKKVVNDFITRYPLSHYAYCNSYSRSKTGKGVYYSKTMGNSVHLDV